MKLEMLAILGLIAGCGSFGCSSDSDVDIGDGRTGQKLTDYAATWEGYVEAHQFPDGSDKVRIILDAQGEGTLLVGDSPAPTTTDADHPPGVQHDVGGVEELLPGFSYTVTRPNVQDSRLRFQVQRSELYIDWCVLQTPFLDTVNTAQELYACVPNVATLSGKDQCWLQPDGSPMQAIDCDKLALCQQSWACFCDSQGCATPEAPPEIPSRFALLDAALANSGDDLTGTLLVSPDTAPGFTVRLKRQ
jgi:hypothetical protein